MTPVVRSWVISAVGAAVGFAYSACTPRSLEAMGAPEDPARTPVVAATAGSGAMQTMLEQIRTDAARRANVAAEAVEVLSVEQVTWADGSLGCPEPGMMYTQALVPGHRIRVDAGGTVLTYHASAGGSFVQCPPGRARPPSPVDPT